MRKTLNISNELNDDIRAYCKEQGINQSQLAEVALRSYLTLYNASKQLAQNFKHLGKDNNDKKEVQGEG